MTAPAVGRTGRSGGYLTDIKLIKLTDIYFKMHSRTLAKITLARKACDITSPLAQAGDFRVENR